MRAAGKFLTGRGKFLTARALKFIASEASGLQRAAAVLALFALLSSLLALLRDRLLAHIFGASVTLDLYYAAFRIPDLLFVAMGALVSVYILIPELARRNKAEQSGYIDTIIAGFSLLSLLICGAAYLFAPMLLAPLFPQFVAQGLLPTLVSLTRIMLLQPVLLGFSNIFAAITQSRHRYLLYSLSPLLYNLGIIVGAGVLYPLWGVEGLAWGVVLGAAMHAGIQVPSLFGDGFLRKTPRLGQPRALIDTVIVSVPRALALSMTQATFLGLTALAGLLAPGSIAVFMFAYNLQAVPLSIIGASYSVAAFPSLAAALARGHRGEFIENVAVAARHVAFWSLPASALLIVLRAHLVRVILGSGAFDWTDTRLTAACLGLFALSLFTQGLTLLIVRAYYAAGRTFVPFAIAAAVALATVFMAAASVGALHVAIVRDLVTTLLRVSNVPGASVLALAFAYALVSILGTVALVVHFEHRFRGFLGLVLLSWSQSFAAALVAGGSAYLALRVIGPITLSSTVLSVLVQGLVGGGCGILFGAVTFYLVRSREFAEVVRGIQKRIGRAPLAPSVVAAAEEHTV